MPDTDDEHVDRPPGSGTGGHMTGVATGVTTGVLSVDTAPEEYGEFADDYIDFVRTAGTSCRHLNRVRRRTARAGGPDDFDD